MLQKAYICCDIKYTVYLLVAPLNQFWATHAKSGYFIEYLWGMSAVLDSAVKVVWQTGRKRECNRV